MLDVHLEMNSLIKQLRQGEITADVFLGRAWYLDMFLKPEEGWRFGDYLPR